MTGSYPPVPGSAIFVRSGAARLIYVNDYGADPSGVNDSTAAFIAAQNAGGNTPYVLVMSVGTYLLGTSGNLGVFGRGQGIIGQGSTVTTVNYVGSGTCFAFYDSSFSTSASYGGPVGGFMMNGINAAAGAVGMSWGNLGNGRPHDIKIQHFNGASSVGLWLKNGVSAWSEEAEWTAINLFDNTNNVIFDNQSFDYSLYQFVIVANSGQNGILLQNTATLEGCRLELRGNFIAGAGNTGSVIAIDPGTPSGTSRIDGAQLYIDVECDGSGTGHVPLTLGGGSNSQFNGQGTVQFRNGSASFQASSINNTSNVWLSGLVLFPGSANRQLPGWQASDYGGYKCMTMDPSAASSSQQLVSGTTYVWGILVRYPTKVSTISLYVVATAASGITASENFVGLFDKNGNLLASAAVDSSFGSTFTLVNISITSQQLAPGQYWIGFLMNATGMPALARGSGLSSTLANLNLPAASLRVAKVGTSQTSLSSFTPSSLTGDGNMIWAALS